jgi:hypothetical protein
MTRFGPVLAMILVAGCGDGGKQHQLPRATASDDGVGKRAAEAAQPGKGEGGKLQVNKPAPTKP